MRKQITMSDAASQPQDIADHRSLDPDRPIDLVIFDCDGVLIDSEIISARVLLGALKDLGVDIEFPYFKANFLGRSSPKVRDAVKRDFGVTLTSEFEDLYRSRLRKAFEQDLRAMPGIETILQRLNIPSCVATSSTPERARHSLGTTGLDSYFPDRVFTASLVRNGKPAPDLFLHAAEALGVDPHNCLVIEDSLPGLSAARAADMQVLHFIGGSHLDESDARNQGLTPPVAFFDKWDAFFDKAPNLKTK